MKKKTLFCFTILLTTFVFSTDARINKEESPADNVHEIAKNRKTKYRIVVPSDASAGFIAKGKDMARILNLSTGATFPVVKETAKKQNINSHNIYIGKTEFAKKHIKDLNKIERNEWIFKSVGQNIIITGSDYGSVNFSFYDFLERYIGYRCFDETTEKIPEKYQLIIPRLDVKHQSAFKGINIGTKQYAIYKGDGRKSYLNSMFLLRNKHNPCWGGSPRGCHTFYEYSKNWNIDPKKHPEYYSMNKNGERKLPKYDNSVGDNMYGHLCLTNPDVSKLLLKQLREFIKKDEIRMKKLNRPDREIYDISQNDPGGRICNCKKCMKLVNSEGGTDSAILLAAINPIAKAIKKEYPHIMLQTFAYKFGIKPPISLKAEDNLRIRIADLGSEWGNGTYPTRDQLFPITHTVNRDAYGILTGWRKKAKSISIWGYWGIYKEKFASPYVVTQCLKSDLETYKANNVDEIYIELDSNVETMSFFALTRWLGYKLMENPYQSVDSLIDEFMQAYYGDAAQYMKKYLCYMEKRILSTNMPLNNKSVAKRPYLDMDFFTTVQSLLNMAEKACPKDSKFLFNVKRERIAVDSAHLNLWKTLSNSNTSPYIFNYKYIYNRYKENRIAQAKAMVSEYYYNDRIKSKIELELMKLTPESQSQLEKVKNFIPKITINKIPGVINNDPGKVDWINIKTNHIKHTPEGYMLENTLSIKAAYDEKNLYLCLEDFNAENLVTGASPWYGDDWEVFLSEQRGLPYHQLTIDPKGSAVGLKWNIIHGKKTSTTWKFTGKIINEKTGKRWSVYITIPLESFLKEIKTKNIYANFYRHRGHKKAGLIWSPTLSKSAGKPNRFGCLKLR